MSEKLLGLPVAADYQPSDGELDNLVYLCLKYTVGWPMRQADKAVVLMMAGEVTGDEGISRVVEQACEYAWDHLAGEPDEFDADKLFDHIKPLLLEWYQNSTPEDRAKTS